MEQHLINSDGTLSNLRDAQDFKGDTVAEGIGYPSYRLSEGGMAFANMQVSCEEHAERQRQRVQALPEWLRNEREAVLNNGHN